MNTLKSSVMIRDSTMDVFEDYDTWILMVWETWNDELEEVDEQFIDEEILTIIFK